MPQKPVARTEFAQAVTQIARERNLDPDIVLDAIKQAKLAAFKKDHPESYREDCLYEVELDPGTGQARIFETPGEIYQEDEQTRVRVQKGATPVDVTPPGFGRIAAQTAKQVIYQKIREAEKSVVVAEYEKRLGTLENGMIIRFVGSDIIVDIGKAEAVMSPSDVAVSSHQSGVDPVGSCVGQKGVRVQAVIGELNGEKLDIVQFSEDLDKYISAALSPASGLTVKVNSKSQTALVTAPADQLPLAIGRDGQKAKLAGKMTGIHIDIIGEKGTSEQKEEISDQDDKPQTSNSNSQ